MVMIVAREEEKQIDWACSAQTTSLLPERFKQQDNLNKKQKTTKVLKAYFE